MLFAISCGTSFLVSHFTMAKSAAKIPKPAIRLRFNGALAAGLIGLVGLIGTAPVAHAADDTARFFGQWKIASLSMARRSRLFRSTTPTVIATMFRRRPAILFAGSGAFSAANGIWFAAAPPPDNGGTYHFVDNDTAICSNSVGQTVTWRRDNTQLPGIAGSGTQPLATASNSQPEDVTPVRGPPAIQAGPRQASSSAALKRPQPIKAAFDPEIILRS